MHTAYVMITFYYITLMQVVNAIIKTINIAFTQNVKVSFVLFKITINNIIKCKF